MADQLLPTNLPTLLRSYGLKVVVVPGWRLRKTQSWQNGFSPVGVLCHHTATSIRWTIAMVLNLLVGGRPGLSGPLSQLGLGRDGTVYVIARGRANHAGTAKASGTVAAGDGNKLYVGIEAFNDGVGEPWPAAQYNAYVLLCAVLSVEVTKNSANTVRGHKETSTTGKIDPTFDMDEFRAKVSAKMDEIKGGVVTTYTRGKLVDHAIRDLRRDLRNQRDSEEKVKSLKAALVALRNIKRRKVTTTTSR